MSTRRRHLVATPNERRAWGGGNMPSLRPHYHPRVARALHALAESRPTPDEYAREKARILGGAR